MAAELGKLLTAQSSEGGKDILRNILLHLSPSSVRSVALLCSSAHRFICGEETLTFWRSLFLEAWDDVGWISDLGRFTYRGEYFRRKRALIFLKDLETSNVGEQDQDFARGISDIDWDCVGAMYEAVADHKSKNIVTLADNGLFSVLRNISGMWLIARANAEANSNNYYRHAFLPPEGCGDECVAKFGLLSIPLAVLTSFLRILSERNKSYEEPNLSRAALLMEDVVPIAEQYAYKWHRPEAWWELQREFSLVWSTSCLALIELALHWARRILSVHGGRNILLLENPPPEWPCFSSTHFPVGRSAEHLNSAEWAKILSGRWHGMYLYDFHLLNDENFLPALETPMTAEFRCTVNNNETSSSNEVYLYLDATGSDHVGDFTIQGSIYREKSCGNRLMRMTAIKEYPPTHSFVYSGVIFGGGIAGGWGRETSPEGVFYWWPE